MHHWLVGDEGDDRDRTFTMCSRPAQRFVLAEAPAGKPSIAVLSTGEIVVSYIRNYRMGRPEGETMEIARSSDGGQTWSAPARATRSPHNDREGYLVRFDDDALLLCYMRVMTGDPEHPWQGPFLCESTDGGRTWSDPWQVDITAFCPHGPYGAGGRGHVVLPDGTLLLFVATYEDPPAPYEYVMVSHDRGRTFDQWYPVSECSGDSSFVLCPDGTIAGALRCNADNFPQRGANRGLREKGETVHFMAFSRSEDGGRTWSTPEPLTGHNEIPGHITALRDGRLLLSFGVRHYPLGIQALVTHPDGRSWDHAGRLLLAWHGGMFPLPGHAKGYCRHTVGHPYTAELPDGRLLTAYYRFADPFDGDSGQVEGLFWEPPDPSPGVLQ